MCSSAAFSVLCTCDLCSLQILLCAKRCLNKQEQYLSDSVTVVHTSIDILGGACFYGTDPFAVSF